MTLAAPRPFRPDWAAVGVISAGGALGSLLRYAVAQAWPPGAGGVPWSTLFINVTGSLLLGLLVVAVTEIWQPHRLTRPALGTGVLGGYTTFSTFAVENRDLLADGHVGACLGYLALSLAGGVLAAGLGMALLRRVNPRRSEPDAAIDPYDPELP